MLFYENLLEIKLKMLNDLKDLTTNLAPVGSQTLETWTEYLFYGLQ